MITEILNCYNMSKVLAIINLVQVKIISPFFNVLQSQKNDFKKPPDSHITCSITLITSKF